MALQMREHISGYASDLTTHDYSDVDKHLSPDIIMLHNVAKGFWCYGSIILLIIGTVGNLLSFVVMMTKQLRGSVTSVYLAVLAVADTMVLYTGLLRQWVRVVFNYDVRLVSNAGCKLHVFLVYTTIWFAIWLLVLVSIERFVNVFFPYSAKRLFNRKRALLSIVGLFLCDVIIHLFFFWVLEIRSTPGGGECDFYDPGGIAGIRIRKVWPPIDVVSSFWLPSALVLLFNVSILLRLRCPRRTATVVPFGNALGPPRGNASGGPTQPKASSMTLTLLGVAFAFLLVVTPMALYLALESKLSSTNEHFIAQKTLWWAIANWLVYCNSSMNFFLYVLAGPRFRRRLCEMLCLHKVKCFRSPVVQGVSANSTSHFNNGRSDNRNTSRSSQHTSVSHIHQEGPPGQGPCRTTHQLHPDSCLRGQMIPRGPTWDTPRAPVRQTHPLAGATPVLDLNRLD